MGSKNTSTIAVVIPALNEEQGIGKTVREALVFATEVIVVDGGSIDKTAEIARTSGAIVVVERERGYGLAFMRGFSVATSDIIATGDGDGTYPISLVPEIVKILNRDGLKFISCSRFPLMDKRSMSARNRIGNYLLNLLGSILWAHRFEDLLSGMWVFNRSALSELSLYSKKWDFSQEIKLEAYMKYKSLFREHKISYAERLGVSKLPPWKVGVENLIYFFIHRLGMRKIFYDQTQIQTPSNKIQSERSA